MSDLGSEQNPLRVAMVGSGPSGFYATEALLKSGRSVLVDMYERLPAPFGLVRNGVAPDHQKLKQPVLVYDQIARKPGFTYLGNVTVGRDVRLDELRGAYHAVMFTSGTETDRRLGIPGEDLPGSHTATEFVGWYNGHPNYRDRVFDLSHEAAVIIGQGNVAIDVCRILSKTVDELKHTDIAQYALDALAQSRIREIHMIGRRGPAQAKFTNKEIREIGELADCDPILDPADLELNPESEAELADKANFINAKNVEIFRGIAAHASSGKNKRCFIRFLEGPVRLEGNSRLERVILEKNRLEGPANNQSARGTGEFVTLPCGLLFRSVGYKGVAIPDVPFDDKRGVIPNQDGRVLDGANVLPGVYTAGWIKRGPSGVIGTNRADSVATVNAMLEDLPKLDTGTEKPGAKSIYPILASRGVRVISYEDWLKIDAEEVRIGKDKGKPREKFTTVQEMLAVLG